MIGDRIKKAREYTGTRQKRLADRLGISPQHLYQYESNRRIPKIETLRKIAGAMDLIVSYNAGGYPFFDLKDEDLSNVSSSDHAEKYENFYNWQMDDINKEESAWLGKTMSDLPPTSPEEFEQRMLEIQNAGSGSIETAIGYAGDEVTSFARKLDISDLSDAETKELKNYYNYLIFKRNKDNKKDANQQKIAD